ncbi:MAG: pseudaminic acid cytidylyltransferase [Cyanobacteria bacterium]|nr:pseudaminic acid cytidylyltransferase [Cyanobacteriota bacterium]
MNNPDASSSVSRLAVIPAKGRSRRLPGKNTRLFYGKPIIAYTIQAALESGLFDTVMVSTDDEATAEIARDLGASVPFLRSSATASDDTMLYEVVEEVLLSYQQQLDRSFQTVCCLLPTAVFITPDKLIQSEKLLTALPDTEGVMTIVRYADPIQRALEQMQDGRVQMVWPENMHQMSNDLPPRYHDGGQFWWITVEALFTQHCLYPAKVMGFEIPESQAVDLDTAEDWAMAEVKYQYYLNQMNYA